ncbi:uncharacterized protein TNCV_1113601 [Trichonephila clavipes]|nr:uncharacterized protein TNCV_1113601 [Trichonephila clavipes]
MQIIRISAQTHITRACGATSKRYLKLRNFDDFKFSHCAFLVVFYKKRSKKRSIQQSAFDQVSEYDTGRIVAYRDCGLFFRKIGSRVGRNQKLLSGYMTVGCRRVRQTDVVDRIHLSAPLHVRTDKL